MVRSVQHAGQIEQRGAAADDATSILAVADHLAIGAQYSLLQGDQVPRNKHSHGCRHVYAPTLPWEVQLPFHWHSSRKPVTPWDIGGHAGASGFQPRPGERSCSFFRKNPFAISPFEAASPPR